MVAMRRERDPARFRVRRRDGRVAGAHAVAEQPSWARGGGPGASAAGCWPCRGRVGGRRAGRPAPGGGPGCGGSGGSVDGGASRRRGASVAGGHRGVEPSPRRPGSCSGGSLHGGRRSRIGCVPSRRLSGWQARCRREGRGRFVIVSVSLRPCLSGADPSGRAAVPSRSDAPPVAGSAESAAAADPDAGPESTGAGGSLDAAASAGGGGEGPGGSSGPGDGSPRREEASAHAGRSPGDSLASPGPPVAGPPGSGDEQLGVREEEDFQTLRANLGPDSSGAVRGARPACGGRFRGGEPAARHGADPRWRSRRSGAREGAAERARRGGRQRGCRQSRWSPGVCSTCSVSRLVSRPCSAATSGRKMTAWPRRRWSRSATTCGSVAMERTPRCLPCAHHSRAGGDDCRVDASRLGIPSRTEVWATAQPLRPVAETGPPDFYVYLVGRLSPGATVEQPASALTYYLEATSRRLPCCCAVSSTSWKHL